MHTVQPAGNSTGRGVCFPSGSVVLPRCSRGLCFFQATWVVSQVSFAAWFLLVELSALAIVHCQERRSLVNLVSFRDFLVFFCLLCILRSFTASAPTEWLRRPQRAQTGSAPSAPCALGTRLFPGRRSTQAGLQNTAGHRCCPSLECFLSPSATLSELEIRCGTMWEHLVQVILG